MSRAANRRPVRQPGWTRRRWPPKPANDAPAFRVPPPARPARDFGRKTPKPMAFPRVPSRLPGLKLPLRFPLPGPAGFLPDFLPPGGLFPKEPAPPNPGPGHWYCEYGPNFYVSPYNTPVTYAWQRNHYHNDDIQGRISGQSIIRSALDAPVPAAATRHSVWRPHNNPSIGRYAQAYAWHRVSTAFEAMPAKAGGPQLGTSAPSPRPNEWGDAAGNPFAPPLVGNAPQIGIPPWARPIVGAAHPQGSPYAPWQSNVAPVRPPLYEIVNPDGSTSGAEEPGGSVAPQVGFTPSPSVGPVSGVSVRPRSRARRPFRGVSERKSGTKKGFAVALGNAFGSATEAGDLLDNLWEALPKKDKKWSFHGGKPVKPNPWRMARNVWEKWENIRLGEFVRLSIQNEIQDRGIAALAKNTGDAGVLKNAWHINAGDKYARKPAEQQQEREEEGNGLPSWWRW